MSRSPLGHCLTAAALLLPASIAACSSHPSQDPTAASSTGGTPASASSNPAPPCPAKPVEVVVSVDQWGDVATELGGQCASVTTILASSSVDPHDYEPSPSDAAIFSKAQLVVVNGVDYDSWASKLAATSAPNAPVVSAGQATGTADGANPHLWYRPEAVTTVADALTAALTKLEPQAAEYFRNQRTAFTSAMQPNNQLLDKIKAAAAGKTYAATETVFDYQAQALGLVNKTPAGFQSASANETDPSPADIADFNKALADHQIDVLIYNTQTEGSIPEQIRAAAQQAGVPIVDVTETVAPGQKSFQSWQDGQLTALAKALGVNV